jgi:1-acyl-sn-glycerol-3-phosphate acyltransferase
VNPGEKDPLAGVAAALERGDILLFYPEGTRGIPERLQAFKTGLAHIAKRHPAVPIVPVFLHGLGKALPKGEALLVPFFCDVFVGEPVRWLGDRKLFMDTVNTRMEELAREGNFPAWE